MSPNFSREAESEKRNDRKQASQLPNLSFLVNFYDNMNILKARTSIAELANIESTQKKQAKDGKTFSECIAIKITQVKQ